MRRLAWGRIRERWRGRGQEEDRAVALLALLSPAEKALLREFVHSGRRTIYVSSPDRAFGLELANVLSIERDPERSSPDVFALGIHPWAWDHLRGHPELVEAAPSRRAAPKALYP